MECTPDPSLRYTGPLLQPWSKIAWEVRYSDWRGEATVEVTKVVGSKPYSCEWLLTDKTSDTWNQSPVAFWPLNAAIAPGKRPTELVPGRAPRILTFGLNLMSPRVPASIILDVSRYSTPSWSFPSACSVSTSVHILPTMTASSFAFHEL